MKNIKRILNLFVLIAVFFNLQAYAGTIITDCEELSICSTKTKVNGPISSFFSKVTGMNFLVSGIL